MYGLHKLMLWFECATHRELRVCFNIILTSEFSTLLTQPCTHMINVLTALQGYLDPYLDL